MTQFKVSSATENFLQKQHKMFIGCHREFADSGETFFVINPATGDKLTLVPAGGKRDINFAVFAARDAFVRGQWPKMTPSKRAQLLWKLADLIELHAEEFAEIESLDNGKPKSVALAADVPLTVDIFRYMAGWATKIDGRTIPFNSDYFAYTLREPVGVVGAIIPWNFPLLMAAWKLAPALAVGCTVVLKPAEQTPLSALRLGELIQEAGFPDGVVNIVTGFGHTAGAALAAHPDVDKIAFTGSTEVGRLILAAAGGNLKKVSLELGGKSPNIIFPDADLDIAIPGAADAIFFNHGQCCCAGSRLYVHKTIFDSVVEGVSEIGEKIRLGSGLDPLTEMGPLVSKEQLDTVCGYIDSGLDAGAKIVLDGINSAPSRGYFLNPTVLTDVKEDMAVVREEIFGPVVVAMPFDSLDEIAAKANNTPYGLAAGIWTKDTAKAQLLARRIRAGTVWINCYNVFDASLPFGGYKQSGWGREMGPEAIELYTQTKTVVQRLQ